MGLDKSLQRVFVGFRYSMETSHGTKKTCEMINKPYPTLMREINPLDSSAKLGFLDAVNILKLDQDGEIFNILREEMGLDINVL